MPVQACTGKLAVFGELLHLPAWQAVASPEQLAETQNTVRLCRAGALQGARSDYVEQQAETQSSAMLGTVHGRAGYTVTPHVRM